MSEMGIAVQLLKGIAALLLSETQEELNAAQQHLRRYLYPEQKVIAENVLVEPCIEDMVMDLLFELNVSPGTKGFDYMVNAITAAVLSPEKVGSVSSQIFSDIAQKNGILSTTVHNMITRSIDASWYDSDEDARRKYFGDNWTAIHMKPSCKEYILRCSMIVRERMQLNDTEQ